MHRKSKFRPLIISYAYIYLGMMTVSMTWIRPLEHLMSVLMTFAVSPMVMTWSTLPTLTPRGCPFTVANVAPVRPVT